MRPNRWQNLGTPVFVFFILTVLGIAFGIGLAVDRVIRLYRMVRSPVRKR